MVVPFCFILETRVSEIPVKFRGVECGTLRDRGRFRQPEDCVRATYQSAVAYFNAGSLVAVFIKLSVGGYGAYAMKNQKNCHA